METNKPVVHVKTFSFLNAFKDGGTKQFKGWDGRDYFQDFRIGTPTPGAIFDRYPGETGAQVLNVRLIEVNVPPDKL